MLLFGKRQSTVDKEIQDQEVSGDGVEHNKPTPATSPPQPILKYEQRQPWLILIKNYSKSRDKDIKIAPKLLFVIDKRCLDGEIKHTLLQFTNC